MFLNIGKTALIYTWHLEQFCMATSTQVQVL